MAGQEMEGQSAQAGKRPSVEGPVSAGECERGRQSSQERPLSLSSCLCYSDRGRSDRGFRIARQSATLNIIGVVTAVSFAGASWPCLSAYVRIVHLGMSFFGRNPATELLEPIIHRDNHGKYEAGGIGVDAEDTTRACHGGIRTGTRTDVGVNVVKQRSTPTSFSLLTQIPADGCLQVIALLAHLPSYCLRVFY